jgi:hypothetical protein
MLLIWQINPDTHVLHNFKAHYSKISDFTSVVFTIDPDYFHCCHSDVLCLSGSV